MCVHISQPENPPLLPFKIQLYKLPREEAAAGCVAEPGVVPARALSGAVWQTQQRDSEGSSTAQDSYVSGGRPVCRGAAWCLGNRKEAGFSTARGRSGQI